MTGPSGTARLSWAQRARLGAEILAIYPAARRRARSSHVGPPLAAEQLAEEPAPQSASYHQGIRLGRAVDGVLRVLPTDGRCLTQSLVLAELLQRRDVPAVLVIGVRSDNGFRAHAWVEYAGLPLLPVGEFAEGRLATIDVQGRYA